MSTRKDADGRPNPEDLLRRISRAKQGKLTLFLGAAAGVGKTYAMLEAAHARLNEGVNVVIGWVETHDRKETDALTEGLERVPPRHLEYRDRTWPEMDTDSLLARKPQLVLVDELAHSNVPGSRHGRRYQDVEELLAAGIDVYTTMNIQHIESLNDIVAEITGVTVRETVPDKVIERADTIQLIDLPPEDLIKRLKEGKVYIPSQAEKALIKFFRPENINSLRELSLRYTARQVEKNLLKFDKDRLLCGPWPVAGRVMVCVGPSPFSAQLVRAARRLAGGLQADWLAVNVELKHPRPMRVKDQARLTRNMHLATELGAQTLTVVGENLAQEIIEVARSHKIATIVIGKPRHSRLWEIIRGSVVDELIRKSGSIDVYVIRSEAGEEQEEEVIETVTPRKKQPIAQCLLGLLMTAVVIILGLSLHSWLEPINIAFLFLLPIVLTAYWWGRATSYFVALASVIAFDFFFVAKSSNLWIEHLHYLWGFITFPLITYFIGGRTERLKSEAYLARIREKSTRVLYEFCLEIAAVNDLDAVAQVIARRAADAIGRKTAVLIPDETKRLKLAAEHDPYLHGNEFDAAEVAVAEWAYQHNQAAGNSTETSPEAKYLYIPLKVQTKVLGILGILVGERKLTPEERRVLAAGAGLAAIAVERAMRIKTIDR